MALDQLRELQSLASSALSETAAVILSYRSELSRLDREGAVCVRVCSFLFFNGSSKRKVVVIKEG